MANNKGSGIFLGVIGVATLLVAIIGATFAFFGANISSGEGAVTVQSTVLALGYKDVITGLKTNLIPAEDYIANYAAMEQLNDAEIAEFNKDKTEDQYYDGNKQCMDDNGNEVCGVYEFTIGNPSFTTSQDLYGNIKVVSNEFEELWFRIYDEEDNQVVAPTAFSTADKDGLIPLTQLNQKLLPSSDDTGKTPDADADGFTATDPTTYTKVTQTLDNGTVLSNVRTYKMVIWIEETNKDQTELNSGKIFTGSITFTTASDSRGVTGVINAAE